jgi:hypothetical protein
LGEDIWNPNYLGVEIKGDDADIENLNLTEHETYRVKIEIKGDDADIENLNLTEHETYRVKMWITGGGVHLLTSFAQFGAELIM